MTTKAERLLSRLASMQAERALVEPFYQAASLYFDPLQARYWARTGTEKRGPNWNGDLFSGAGIQSMTRLTNFLQGNGTPSADRWLELADAELAGQPEADQFWADQTKLIERELRGTPRMMGSFYISKRMEYRNMSISYGVSAIYEQQEAGMSTGHVIHENVPAHGFFFQLDAFGRMKCGAYCRSMTDDQLWSIIRKRRVNAEVGDMKDAKSSDRHDIVQMCVMNDKPRAIPRDPEEFPFTVYWIDRAEKSILFMEGYYSQLFYVTGWNQIPNSNYFVGPCYEALPDMVSAAAARKSQIMAMEWAGTPPLLGADKIEGAEKTLRPRRITWGAMGGDGKPRVQAMVSGANPGALFQQVADDEQRVRSMMFNDELLSQRRPNMTATEAQIVAAERAAMVAPIWETTNHGIAALIARHFEINLRAGKVRDVPRSVALEGEFSADVVGPLAMAARQTRLGAMMNTIESLSIMEQAPTQYFDKEEGARLIAESNGNLALLRDFAEVKEEMAAMAAQQQEAVAAEVENTETQSMKNLAQAATEMDPAA